MSFISRRGKQKKFEENLDSFYHQKVKDNIGLILKKKSHKVIYMSSYNDINGTLIKENIYKEKNDKAIVIMINHHEKMSRIDYIKSIVSQYIAEARTVVKQNELLNKVTELSRYIEFKDYTDSNEMRNEKKTIIFFKLGVIALSISVIVFFIMNMPYLGIPIELIKLIATLGSVKIIKNNIQTYKMIGDNQVNEDNLIHRFLDHIAYISNKKYNIIIVFDEMTELTDSTKDFLYKFKNVLTSNKCSSVIIGDALLEEQLRKILELHPIPISLVDYQYLQSKIKDFSKPKDSKLLEIYLKFVVYEADGDPLRIKETLLKNIHNDKLTIKPNPMLENFKEVYYIVMNLIDKEQVNNEEIKRLLLRNIFKKLFHFNERITSFSYEDMKLRTLKFNEIDKMFYRLMKRIVNILINDKKFISVSSRDGGYHWNKDTHINFLKEDSIRSTREGLFNQYYDCIEQIIENILILEKCTPQKDLRDNFSKVSSIMDINNNALDSKVRDIYKLNSDQQVDLNDFILQNISSIIYGISIGFIKYIFKQLNGFTYVNANKKFIDLIYKYQDTYIKISFEFFYKKEEFDAGKIKNTFYLPDYEQKEHYILILLFLGETMDVDHEFKDVDHQIFTLINLKYKFRNLRSQLNNVVNEIIINEKKNYKG